MEFLKRLLVHGVSYFVLYLIAMLPTYFLPYLGSNSAVVGAAGMASGIGLSPQFWLHAILLAILAYLAWLRGNYIGRSWLVVFPVLAAVFDLTPGLSLIPMVPTIMHLLAIVIGVVAIRDVASMRTSV